MVKVGDGYINKTERRIKNVITRWREPVEESKTLHAGKFIVDWIKDGKVHLSDANWNEYGKITFHSSKHGHVLDIKDLRKLRKFRGKLW